MGAFLKKDILVLLRDRTELAVLLAMPFILIAILGFALRGLIGGDTEALNMQVAIVQHDDEQEGIEQFTAELDAMDFPEQAAQELETAAEEVSPYSLLRDVLSDDSLNGLVTVTELEAAAAEQALEEEEVVAVLTIPENFTYAALQKMLLSAGGGSELQLLISDYGSIQASVFQSIVNEFTHSLNFETALARAAGVQGGLPEEESALGGVETVSEREPITSFQYYTIGMAVMFVLFVSSTISGKANVERFQHVFNRILLSDRHPFVYLGGKAISAAVVAFCQLFILFALSALVFRSFGLESLGFWSGMALISAVLSICIGGLTVLLTTLTLRVRSEAVTAIFAGGIVTIFAFLGGSFLPVSEMPEVIGSIGDWTPNGAALSAYMMWMQDAEWNQLLVPLSRIALTAVVLALAGLLLFPKRGEM